MNYLAHAVLSFGNPGILTGNMISDFVKGRKKYKYPLEIMHGIQLHRLIDNFTDHHPATKKAESFFRADYRLYSGPIIDIVYDHFLANDKNEFKTALELKKFADETYQSLEKSRHLFPHVFASMFPFMKNQDWLYHYHMVTGIQKSLHGLYHRALYMNPPEKAYHIFLHRYTELQSCYEEFFPQVKQYALEVLNNFNAH